MTGPLALGLAANTEASQSMCSSDVSTFFCNPMWLPVHWSRKVASLLWEVWSVNLEMAWMLHPAEHPADLSKGLQQLAEQTAE